MVIRAHIKTAHPEWEFLEAVSGEEAIGMALQHRPEYCTMDINMPGMLGTDAAEKILQAQPGIKVAIFSANVQDTMQQRANMIGAIFVAKPVTDKSITQVLNFFASGK